VTCGVHSKSTNRIFFELRKDSLEEKISLKVSALFVNPARPGWRFDFPSKFQCKVTPHEIVMATKELQVILKTFPPPSLNRSFGDPGTPCLIVRFSRSSKRSVQLH
jgi:hypothetical protein